MPGAVVFAYHAFGHEGLLALLRGGWDVRLVLSHADHPQEQVWWPSVAALAQRHGIPVLLDADLKDPALAARIAGLAPDCLFSFYFRHLIPEPVLALAPRGAFNLHGSLLPTYRGRSPVNWQLVHGERRSGITLHRMVRKPDAGRIIAQAAVDVHPDQDAMGLTRQLLSVTPALLDRALADIAAGTAVETEQDHTQATYFGGRKPEDGRIEWSWPARRIHDLVRAVARPWPGAFADLAGRRVQVWRTRVAAETGTHGAPGTLIAPARVACGTGAIDLLDTTPALTDSALRTPDSALRTAP